jgi:hypothetical protein
MSSGSGVASATDKRWDAIKDIGWFPMTYSAVVGGPTILAIAQTAFKEWRLTPAFQWIVEGYHRLTALMTSYIEPYIVAVFSWIGSVLGVHWSLTPMWQPFILLYSIMLVAISRAWWGSVVSRDLPELLDAALFVAVVLIVGLANAFLLVSTFVIIIVGIGIEPEVGILASAAMILAFGVIHLFKRDPFAIRLGFNLLGGFFTTAMIVGADQLLKWLS